MGGNEARCGGELPLAGTAVGGVRILVGCMTEAHFATPAGGDLRSPTNLPLPSRLSFVRLDLEEKSGNRQITCY